MADSEHKVNSIDGSPNVELYENGIQKAKENTAAHGQPMNGSDDEKSKRPIDRGWAWVILAGLYHTMSYVT